MDEVEENEPYVFIEDEVTEAPRRRPPWLWGGLAGAVLLAALGGLTFLPSRRPAGPPSPPVEEIAFVDADPVSPEEPAAPAEPVSEAAPVVLPPIPAPTPPQAEPPVVAVAPLPVLKEAPVDPPPPAPVEPAKAPPAPEEPLSFVKGLASAAAAIGDAKPLLFEVVDHFDPPDFHGDVLELAAKMDRVEERLQLALGIYDRLRVQMPDPGILDQRLEAIRDLLEALTEGRARIRVPFALKKAKGLQEEAAPLAKEALDGFQPYSREAQALDVRAEVAAGKLREARRLYESIRKDVPDPETVDQRLKAIDARLAELEGRYPQMSAR